MDYYGLSGTLSKQAHSQRYQHLLREEAFMRFYTKQIQDQALACQKSLYQDKSPLL